MAIRVFTILALGAIGAAAAVVITALRPVQYESTSVLLVPGAATRADNEAVVRSLEALIVSPPVAEDIATAAGANLTAPQVVSRMTVTRPPDSSVLEVSVLDTDQDRSVALARAAGPALVARFNTIATTVGTAAPSVAEYAVVTVNGDPTSTVVEPPRARNGLIGLGIGLLLGAGLAALRPRRSRPILTELEASEAFDTPLYATLPILGSGSWRDHSLDVPDDLLPIGWPPSARRMVVLGSGGRPTVRLVELLASAITQSGRDVLLVDAEPEERGLTATFDHLGRPGFVDVLSGRADAAASTVLVGAEQLPREMASLVPPDGGRISFLPAGDLDVAPAVLAGGRVTQVLRRLRSTGTIVVHAPRLPGSYAANQFIEFADAIVIAAVAGRTRVEEAESVARLVTSLTSAPVYVVLLTAATEKRGGGRHASRSWAPGPRLADDEVHDFRLPADEVSPRAPGQDDGVRRIAAAAQPAPPLAREVREEPAEDEQPDPAGTGGSTASAATTQPVTVAPLPAKTGPAQPTP
jgi:capsular polysaccharide biosynthesis protein